MNTASKSMLDDDQLIEPVRFDFAVDRRDFLQVLGGGILITVVSGPALAQRRRGGGGFFGGPPPNVAARLHIGRDGTITVLAGKTEMGQGARGELTQAAAEELHVSLDQIGLVLADTGLVPNDGLTAGSRTTPSTVPSVRQAAAAARQLLVDHAARQWNVAPDAVEVRDGQITHPQTGRTISYAQLARDEALLKLFAETVPANVAVTPVAEWQVLGTSYAAPNRRDLVAGGHRFPSDMARPGMLYGAVLRPPTYGAKLVSVDLGPAQAMADAMVVQDGEFVGVAAPTAFRAREAVKALAATANWKAVPQPSSDELYNDLRQHARGGVPANPFAEEAQNAPKSLRQTYQVAYVQHAPMEPRAALAEWSAGGLAHFAESSEQNVPVRLSADRSAISSKVKLTVWAGTQNPFGYQGELSGAFRLPSESVRVIVPDFGGGFGGKHTGEAAIEAARLAKAAARPVLLRWTREEEFTAAYFRPAGVIEAEASLGDEGRLTTWHFVNVNSGGSALEPPYNVGRKHCRFVESEAPLRQGSYRALAATANTFARESFMDELAAAAGVDPLEFRLAHLADPRLRAVLEEAARQFRWPERASQRVPGRGVGLACGTEKGSYVAACVEVEVQNRRGLAHVAAGTIAAMVAEQHVPVPLPEDGSGIGSKQIRVLHVCEAFECGAIINPDNLRAQIEGCIVMGLGPALREEVRFKDGVIENATFRRYRVPHFSDTPTLDIHLVNRPDLPSVGAGETPIIAVAPAIANAVFHATGLRIRRMPMTVGTT